ncbi:MAG: LD-carboxypeptidase [Desulfosalsimonadaceae bacterium]|nr:LD-carboxypeptidase [Desulfosalsimonadaceae bacterium]
MVVIPPSLLPARLSPGDTVSVVAPSSPFDREKFQKGIFVLEEIGLRPLFMDGIFETQGYLAGSDAHRARLIHESFADPAIKGIFCARGGYGALRLLQLMDFGLVAAHPKVFIGCSDVSVLLNVFYSSCRLVTFHGPMMESLGRATQPTKQALIDTLFTGNPVTVTAENKVVIRPGACSGVVSGGNLTTLCHLAGTRYAPDFKGHIVMLEDIGEQPYRIDRMLTHMRMAGCFNGVSGLALGSFKDCGEPDQIYRIFEDIFSDFPIPILAGFDVGHDEPNLTIPFGIGAILDADGGRLLYSGSAVSG